MERVTVAKAGAAARWATVEQDQQEMTKMTDAKEAALLEGLKQAGKRMTAEDVKQQKISFIMGSLSNDSEITRDRVEAELNKMAGTPSET